MPRNFEGNLAHQLPPEEAESKGRRKRSAGPVELKELHSDELQLIESGKKLEEYKTLDQSDLKPDEEDFESLNPNDLEPEREEAIDLTDEAKEEKDERIESGEEWTERIKKKNQLGERIERTRKETAEIENSTKKTYEEIEQKQKQATEEHAKNVEFISSAEHRAFIHDSMKEELEAVRSEVGFEAELEKDAKGEVRGLKNISLVHWNAFTRAMSARMNAIKAETIKLLEGRPDSSRDARLKSLEEESSIWMEMYRDGKIMERSGMDSKDIQLYNRMYRQIETVPQEGISRVEEETIAVTPDEKLETKIIELDEQDKEIDILLQAASRALEREVGDAEVAKEFVKGEGYSGKLLERIKPKEQRLMEYLRGVDHYRQERKKEIAREVLYLRSFQEPDKLDLRSQVLTRLIAESQESMKAIKEMLRVSPLTHDLIGFAKTKIDDIESETIELEADLKRWQEHPVRQEAMEARKLNIEEYVRQLELSEEWEDLTTTIHVQDPKKLAETNFRNKGISQEVKLSSREELNAYRDRVAAIKNEVIHLSKRKASIANERAAIVNEQVDRELARLEVMVDLSGLTQPEGVEVEVDTSDFEVESASAVRKSSSRIRLPRIGRSKKKAA